MAVADASKPEELLLTLPNEQDFENTGQDGVMTCLMVRHSDAHERQGWTEALREHFGAQTRPLYMSEEEQQAADLALRERINSGGLEATAPAPAPAQIATRCATRLAVTHTAGRIWPQVVWGAAT